MARPYAGTDADLQPTTRKAEDKVQPVSIARVIAFLNASGLIPDEGQVFADIAASLPLLGRFEHALTLLDVSSRIVRREDSDGGDDPGGKSLRLNDLQSAAIFRTNGRERLVLDQLNRVVSRYTNAGVATLENREIHGYSYQVLADNRLPDWAVWGWGRFDDFFVIAFGKGAFEKIAATYVGEAARLSEDEWFTAASARTEADSALAHWFIALARLERRLGSVAHGRHSRVVKALEADNMTHDLWAIGQQGRALRLYRTYRRGGVDTTRRYSEPGAALPRHLRVVPAEARRFGIFNVPTSWLVDNLPRAWVAARSESHVATWQRLWELLEQETGVDISACLINNLGGTVIIFDYPRHPLDIPFALTIAIEVKDPKPVRLATDTLLSTWSRYLDENAERKGTTLVRVKVKQAQDGVWYLQAGILGPALKVTDRYVVLSWSPMSLREALEQMERGEKQQPGEKPATAD
jgi:hypothetical protein